MMETIEAIFVDDRYCTSMTTILGTSLS